MTDFKTIIIDGCETNYTVDTAGRIYSGFRKRFLKDNMIPLKKQV